MEFFNLVAQQEEQLKQVDSAASDYLQRIDTALLRLSKELPHGNVRKTANGEASLAALHAELIDGANRQLRLWMKNHKDELDRQALREQFVGQFLVFIYGRVKAGKSTLGNYLAQLSPTKPEWYVWDVNGSADDLPRCQSESNSFATRITECTSDIQVFVIPGLAWIDSPGLGSTTSENHALARKFVESADLVIYPMSSDAPARREDIESLMEIIKCGKRFVLLLTKSDF